MHVILLFRAVYRQWRFESHPEFGIDDVEDIEDMDVCDVAVVVRRRSEMVEKQDGGDVKDPRCVWRRSRRWCRTSARPTARSSG